jgi:hypothetical protein
MRLDLAELDDDGAGKQAKEPEAGECCMYPGAYTLLLGGMSWLEDESSLCNKQKPGRVEELSTKLCQQQL